MSPLLILVVIVGIISIAATGYILLSSSGSSGTTPLSLTENSKSATGGFNTQPLPTYQPISQTDTTTVIQQDLKNTNVDDFQQDSQQLDSLIKQI